MQYLTRMELKNYNMIYQISYTEKYIVFLIINIFNKQAYKIINRY